MCKTKLNWEYKIFQLVDDTTILTQNLDSLKLTIAKFLKFKKISGLKLNLEKCKIVKLGPTVIKRSDLPSELSNLKIYEGPAITAI